MDNLIGHSITVFLAFFAVMNPIANAAAFVGLTGGQDQAARKQTALSGDVEDTARRSRIPPDRRRP
jgi:small neutral amino acid transporter SnatA (MarC family)